MGKPGEEVEAKRIVLTAVCETCDQVFGATVIWFGETHGTPWLQAVHLRNDLHKPRLRVLTATGEQLEPASDVLP